MNENKRVKLTYGTATVDKNCSKETLTALDQLSKLAYEMESKPLNIDSVSKIAVCQYCDNELCDAQAFNQQCFKCGKKPF